MNRNKALYDEYRTSDLYIMKRSGERVPFDKTKIIVAISKANAEVGIKSQQVTDDAIKKIADDIERAAIDTNRDYSVEEIQDMVEDELMDTGKHMVARRYITYRYKHNQKRDSNGLDKRILAILRNTSDDAKEENSNKNTTIVSVQRDYMAGEWSRYYTEEYLLPKEITEAHKQGIIHFHDSDYAAMALHNCCLINLDDMLQNGTKISGTAIDTPKSYLTTCTVTSQVIAQVASMQYGGQTISLAHIAPFVDVSRRKIRKRYRKEWTSLGIPFTEKQLEDFVAKELLKEVEAGCQTIQYQLVTLQTTNGQAPFVSVFMYLNEVPEGQTRDDLALIIEIMLKQRIKGIKDETGHYITPAFPKLLYVLQEDNITEDGKYWYLTHLAAQCTAKRMVPDYISEKVMLEMKGDVYPCMGCVDGKEVITYKYNNNVYTESFERMWDRLAKYFEIGKQPNLTDFVMRTPGVKIYDQKEGFVDNYGIIKNHNSEWLRITFSNGRTIMCTPDHPFENTDGKLVYAVDLTENDLIDADTTKDDTLSPTCYITNVEHITKDGFSYDVTTSSEHFTVSGIYSHNCRSFLTPDRFTDRGLRNIANAGNWDRNKHKYYGRFNMGVVTINLVDVACSSAKDENEFWRLLDERLELCHKALRIRYEHLLGTPSDVAPIQWQDGALARLAPGETIDELLQHGYATISLGYAGLAECTQYMRGCWHTQPKGHDFAIAVMERLNEKCESWKEAENIDYSVYGTPLESTTYKFAKCLQRRFGIIPNVTDHNYITNSYHVNVREDIDAFTKLTMEAEFQKLSPGGAISYVEVPNMQDNIEALESIIKHIYNTIMYAEINTKSDLCMKCGYDGEIQIVNIDGKLGWECPKCHNRDQSTMHVARRTCGYIGTQYWNQGRTQEIKDRVLHVSVEKKAENADKLPPIVPPLPYYHADSLEKKLAESDSEDNKTK